MWDTHISYSKKPYLTRYGRTGVFFSQETAKVDTWSRIFVELTLWLVVARRWLKSFFIFSKFCLDYCTGLIKNGKFLAPTLRGNFKWEKAQKLLKLPWKTGNLTSLHHIFSDSLSLIMQFYFQNLEVMVGIYCGINIFSSTIYILVNKMFSFQLMHLLLCFSFFSQIPTYHPPRYRWSICFSKFSWDP